MEKTFIDYFNGLLIVVFLSLISTFIGWKLHFFHISKSLSKPFLRVWEPIIAFALFLSGMIVVGPLSLILFLFFKTGTLLNVQNFKLDVLQEGLLNVTTILITATLLGGYTFFLNERAKKSVLGSGSDSFTHRVKSFAMGSVAWFFCYPLVMAINQLMALIGHLLNFPEQHHEQVAVKYLKMTAQYPTLFLVTALLLIFVVPVIEELLFRGFLQNYLKQFMKSKWAIIITSIIFAFFHFSSSQGLDNIELLSSLFVLSCFLGFLFERQQSIFASIGLHATFNAISVLLIIELS